MSNKCSNHPRIILMGMHQRKITLNSNHIDPHTNIYQKQNNDNWGILINITYLIYHKKVNYSTNIFIHINQY